MPYRDFREEWRTQTIRKIEQVDGLTDVYEFGVFSGNSMIELDRICHGNGIQIDKLVGFDSFTGIPKETAEPLLRDEWDPDTPSSYSAFNSMVLTGASTREDAMRLVKSFVDEHMASEAELILVAGLYSESLTPELPQQLGLGKALIVDIDCDIYTSSKQALSWVFSNGLVDTGTYVVYDDWGGTPGYKQGLDGESRAHREISEEYGVEWQKVASHTHHVEDSQVVFRLR